MPFFLQFRHPSRLGFGQLDIQLHASTACVHQLWMYRTSDFERSMHLASVWLNIYKGETVVAKGLMP